MQKSSLIRYAPCVLAAVLLVSYASIIFGVPMILQPIVNFKIEMSGPTILTIQLTRLFIAPVTNIVCASLIFGLAFALVCRQNWAWWVGFFLTLLFWLSLLPLLLPFVAIYNSVGSGYRLTPQIATPIALAIIAAPLPSLIFFALHRAFRGIQAPQPQNFAA